MLIPDALAQHIVDAAQAIIRCNVNIMDREGVIIGTAQPERKRTFHKGARDVIESGRDVEIRARDVARYPGARAGVNLPIVLEGQVIGVVGVTGDPDAVRDPARLIKMITELILERELVLQEMHSRQRLAGQLIEMLIAGGEQYRPRIVRAARSLGLDIEQPRLVAVADVSGLLRGFSSEYGDSGLVQDRSAEAILEGVHARGCLGPQDVSSLLERRLVLLKAVPQASGRAELREWGEGLLEALEALGGGKVVCGIGAAAQSLDEYPSSYRQAVYCLRAREGGRALRLIHDNALCAGYLLEQAAAGPGAMALRPWDGALREAFGKKPELRETAEALSAHNFECEQTAFALGIHRNTLAYRMARLRDMTGLDPAKRLDDAILFRAFLAGAGR